MKAAVVEEPGRLVIKDLPTPKPKENQVLLKIRAASICNSTDVRILEGKASGDLDHYPQILGHEVNGEVVALGPNVKGINIGDRIVTCIMYQGFAEYAVKTIPEGDGSLGGFAIVPEEIPDEEVSLCEMFDGSLIGTVFPAQIQPWEKVLIVGLGPMGLTTAQCVKAVGADTVVGVDLFNFRLKKAMELGVDYVYNRSEMSTEEIVEEIKREVGSIDVAIMCIDVDKSKEGDAYDLATETLRRGGRLTGLSVEAKGRGPRVNAQEIFRKRIKIARQLNPEVYGISPRDRLSAIRKAWQLGVNWVRDGKINMKALISAHVPLEDIHRGLMLCKNKPDKIIKVVVDIGV